VNFSGLLGKSSPANRVTGTAEVPDISDGIASAPRTWQKGSACDVLRDAIFGSDHGATQADRRPMKIFVRLTLAICAWAAFLTASLGGNIAPDHERPSVCYGDSVSGRLEGGTRLSYSGENYRAYSMLGFALVVCIPEPVPGVRSESGYFRSLSRRCGDGTEGEVDRRDHRLLA
jgi:hypothetical protein